MVTKHYSHTLAAKLTPKKHHTNVIEECDTIRLAISVLCVSISVPFCWHVWGVSNPGNLAPRGASTYTNRAGVASPPDARSQKSGYEKMRE